MKTFFHKFFYLLDNQAKKRLPFLMLSFLFLSALDVFGIGMIGVFLGIISSPETFISKMPYSSYLASIPNSKLIFGVGIAIIIAFILKAIFSYLIQKSIVSFSYSCSLRMKLNLMQAYQFAPFSFHLKNNSSALISRLNQIDAYATSFIVPLTTLTSSALISLGILALLLSVQPISTIVLSLLFATIVFMNNTIVRNKSRKIGLVLAHATTIIMKSIRHSLTGLKEIRVLGKEEYFLDSIKGKTAEYTDAQSYNQTLQLVPRFVIESVLAVFVICLCLIDLSLGVSASALVASVGMFAAAGVRLLPIATQFTAGINQIKIRYPTLELLYDEFRAVSQSDVNALKGNNSSKKEFNCFELKDIYFNYENSKNTVLNNINIKVCKGQSIGLIGVSGSGKSTTVNVMLGLLRPLQGDLLVDEEPIENIREWLNNFAYIPQEIFLLDDTLKRNIALGELEIDDNKVLDAISKAQLNSVVEELPEGVDTMLGENGVRLSGGQRQRVALARAFYHERDIIIMDEATSALDNETEKEVIDSIKKLKGQKTLIVIAHRLTTVKHCDVIYKLEKGRVIDSGTFEEVVGETII